MFLCRCQCGKEVRVDSKSLRKGHTKSCGCLQSEFASSKKTHGMDRTPTYWVWQGMKNRCLNKNSGSFKNYGGRGIGVCDRWKSSFENFLADMGTKPARLSLGRINNNGDYEPSNCRWETTFEQANNTRKSLKVGGKGETLAILVRQKEVSYSTAYKRLQNGMSFKNVFSKQKFKTGTKPK